MSSFASGLNGDRFTVPTQRAPSSTRGSTGDGHLLFVFMGGMMLGAKVAIADWWLWNQIPVTIGNLLGGWLLIGLPMYLTYGRRSAADGSLTKIEHDGQVREFAPSER